MESVVWKHSTSPGKQFKITVSIGKVVAVSFYDTDRIMPIDFTLCDVTVTDCAVADQVTLQYLKQFNVGGLACLPECTDAA